MISEYCNLTMEEIAAISPNIRDMTAVRVDKNTVVYLPKPATEKQIKQTIKKYKNLWKEQKNHDTQFKLQAD